MREPNLTQQIFLNTNLCNFKRAQRKPAKNRGVKPQDKFDLLNYEKKEINSIDDILGDDSLRILGDDSEGLLISSIRQKILKEPKQTLSAKE